MIKCAQCGETNQLGAVFCRSCGVRLDMESVEQQLKQREKQVTKGDVKRWFSLVRRLIALGLLAIVVLILVGLFMPARSRVAEQLDGTELAEAFRKIDAIRTHIPGQRVAEFKVTLSSKEVSAVTNRLIGLQAWNETEAPAAGEEDVGAALAPEHITVELLASGYTRLVLRSRTFKNLKVYSVLVGRFMVRDDGVEFFLHSAYAGKVRMIGPLKQTIVNRFAALIEGDRRIEMLRDRIDDLTVTRDEVELTVGAGS